MNTLIIDTSTSIEMIIACSNGKIKSTIEPVNYSHSVTLFENIEACLKSLGITINDIDLFGVGIGPGSFTGIRIAISTVRMLSQVTSSPLAGIKTQLIYAVSIPAEEGDNILIAFDAKKKKVFGALYKKTASLIPEEIIPPGDYSIDFLLTGINQEKRTIATGDGIEIYYEKIINQVNSIEVVQNYTMDCKSIIDLFVNEYKKNPDKYKDYTKTAPFYSRKSDAEIAKEGPGRTGK